MDAGSFRYKIDINIASYTQNNDFGNQVPSYTINNVWAHIKYNAANEKLEEGILSAMQLAVFTVRYSEAIKAVTAKDQIIYDGNTFDIKSIVKKGLGNKSLIEITGIFRE